MPTPLSIIMFRTIRAGWQKCHPDTAARLLDFVRSRLAPAGGFADRHGNADLYYTMFGLLIAAAAGLRLDLPAQETYLRGFAPNSLDLVHLACLTRSHALLLYLRQPAIARFTAILRRRRLTPPLRPDLREAWDDLNADAGADAGVGAARFPHHDPWSPYSQLLRWSLAGDLGLDFTPQRLEQYRLTDGLFANLPGDSTPAVNATAAALMLLNDGRPRPDALRPDLERLATLQTQTGGFPATPMAPGPDLLSTATASLALHCCGRPAPFSLKPFLRQTITDAGGFGAFPGDDTPDLEYTAYGLVAMGLTS